MFNLGSVLDPYIDSEEEVLKIRKEALRLMREGKTIMSWTGEGVTSEKQFTMKIEDVLAETRYCLKLINGEKYGFITNSSRQFRF